jgi:hypothetical protein
MKLWRGKYKAVSGPNVNSGERGFQGKWFTVLSTNDIRKDDGSLLQMHGKM